MENIDSHLDIIGVEVITDCRPTGGSNTIHRKLSFQRFWQKDEFGVFFISYNIKQHDGFEMGIKVFFFLLPYFLLFLILLF